MIAPVGQQPRLSGLQQRLLRLAQSVDSAMIGAQQSLLNRDVHAAEDVIAAESAHDSLRDDLDREAHRLLAQAPGLLGSDLRMVTSALVLAAELERIGEYATGIATIVARSAQWQELEAPAALNQMAYKAREMLQAAMRAVVTQDARAVQRLREEDRIVDRLYQQMVGALLTTMRADPDQSEWATYLLWVGHNLERMADRSANIAARAAFIATGIPAMQGTRNARSAPGSARGGVAAQD